MVLIDEQENCYRVNENTEFEINEVAVKSFTIAKRRSQTSLEKSADAKAQSALIVHQDCGDYYTVKNFENGAQAEKYFEEIEKAFERGERVFFI